MIISRFVNALSRLLGRSPERGAKAASGFLKKLFAGTPRAKKKARHHYDYRRGSCSAARLLRSRRNEWSIPAILKLRAERFARRKAEAEKLARELRRAA